MSTITKTSYVIERFVHQEGSWRSFELGRDLPRESASAMRSGSGSETEAEAAAKFALEEISKIRPYEKFRVTRVTTQVTIDAGEEAGPRSSLSPLDAEKILDGARIFSGSRDVFSQRLFRNGLVRFSNATHHLAVQLHLNPLREYRESVVREAIRQWKEGWEDKWIALYEKNPLSSLPAPRDCVNLFQLAEIRSFFSEDDLELCVYGRGSPVFRRFKCLSSAKSAVNAVYNQSK